MSEKHATNFVTTGDFLKSDDGAWSRGNALTVADDGLVGVTLNGTYVVERVLGEGGMGRVYLARHTRIAQKRVAIKVLHDEYARNQEVLVRFQREAEAAAAVSHPNVMTVLDVDRTPNGLPYLVCEYLEGIDLSEHLKRVGKLDVATALYFAQKLCAGLGAAHASGVIHRDLKPQNVFLLGDFAKAAPARPELKILDFGLSRFLDTATGDQLTKTGYIMGTPAYMAPEQARGLKVDRRVDVYGVGAILFTALTGRAPFEGDTPQATVLAVLNSEAPRPRSLEPSIPPYVELAIERALAREADERYPDMATFAQALQALEPAAVKRASEASVPRGVVLPAPSDPLGVTSVADVNAARPRLLLFLLAAVLLVIGGAVTAVTGVELAIGYAFNRVELRLLLLAILGISLTPAVLWFSRIRSEVWHNSSRVLALLGQVRAGVVAALVGYGVSALSLHLVDDFLVRLLGDPRLKPLLASWPGWNLLLTLVALVCAVFMLLRRRVLVSVRPGFRQLLALTLVSAASLGLVASIVVFGLHWRDQLLLRSTPAKVTQSPAQK
ncbi:MAG TPA: serine/threonine-protein kinase [Polyangiaceae bacterium]|nr:serine/threonine-protein kinase [Polyangiaceae bacterium]